MNELRQGASTSARIQVGSVPVNVLRFGEAVDEIERLLRTTGGAVFTPNVDHVVMAEENPTFRAAYARAELSLADGQPVVWASRLFSTPLPDKISGSDLLLPLMERAAQRGIRVFLLGGAPGVAEEAARLLRTRHGVNVVGTAAPMLPPHPDPASVQELVGLLRRHEAQLVVVALGAPKQELLIDALKDHLRPAVLVGVGASLDFLIGRVARAPRWMSRAGLEWFYRLMREPRRMWRRYLLRDPAFFGIVLKQLLLRRRALTAQGSPPPREARG